MSGRLAWLLSPRIVSRVFRRYADRANLPENVRLHDLRYTAITKAMAQGEDILLVAAFAGHAKTSTTVDVYSHLLPQRDTRGGASDALGVVHCRRVGAARYVRAA